MPSLNALGEFKYSFNNIGKEKADIEALKLPFDDLTLPTTEAPPFEFIRHETPVSDNLGFDEGSGDVDLSSFLDNIGGDAPPPIDMPVDNAISALDDFLKEINTPSSPEPETGADDLSSFLDGMQNDTTPDTSGADGFDLSSLTGGQDEVAPDVPSTDNFDLSSLTGEQDESTPDVSSTDNFDLSSLTGGQDEAAPDVSSTDNFDLSSLTGGQDEAPLADEGGFPDDLLSGFSDEMESTPADDGIPDFSQEDLGTEETSKVEAQPAETENDDPGAIDLGGESRDSVPDTSALADADASFDDLNFSVDTLDSGAAAEKETPQPDQDLGAIDLGGESPDFMPESASGTSDVSDEIPDFSQDSANIDLGGESLDLPTETASDDLSSDTLPDMDFPGADDSALDTNFDVPAQSADFSDTGDTALADDTTFDTGTGSETTHDFGDLGADFASDSIELDSGSGDAVEGEESDSGFSGDSGDVFGGDDFSLTGLDDILNKSKVSAPKPVQKKGLFGRKKRKEKQVEEIKAEDNIDEISLSQEDVDNLLDTLSTYPLNLRITCEELIAEQVILPEQLSKLIRLLVNGAGVRETAAHVETITGKPVIIPRSFEKSSGAEFEAEQSSFAYIFVHNLLPVLKLFAFIALMAGSVFYLSYKFIYTPLKAESIYKRGYERIPAGEYQRANELFHDAFTLHRKKKWFYSYAEAFRDQRRYMLAENKYDELLRY
jgi:hypothetical protein